MKYNILSRLCYIVCITLSSSVLAYGQCKLVDQQTFTPQGKKIKLVTNSKNMNDSTKIISFKTSLRVNTDGAPNSYHPYDLNGSIKAINNICNGVGVYKIKPNGQQIKIQCQEAKQIFAKFRDNDWRVPSDYKIIWQNVIASKTENGKTIPCIFQKDAFKGYFGSLTSLQNGLSKENAGECGYRNQLDQRIIPAFVMPSGPNPLSKFGARLGDILAVYNPKNGIVTVAIIGDTGPGSNLGEGSVGLNMALLDKTAQPLTYQDALKLDTSQNEMLIAIIPNSKNFHPQKPFTKENIVDRFQNWLKQAGFTNEQDFVEFIKSCN